MDATTCHFCQKRLERIAELMHQVEEQRMSLLVAEVTMRALYAHAKLEYGQFSVLINQNPMAHHG
jgi:hypothetical protein